MQIKCMQKEFVKIGEYRDLYVKSDALLLADLFKHFRNICLETYEPDPACFLTAPELA